MNRETLSYISRKMRDERQNGEHDVRDNPSGNRPEYPEYEEHRISSRYRNSTNTYRAEGVVEGRIEHHDPHAHQGKRTIGFGSQHNAEECDLVYALEEAFEQSVMDITFYSELAMEAERKGHVELANGFYEIAKDKLACAEFIRHCLVKCGSYDPVKQTELETMFDKAKHAFRRL